MYINDVGSFRKNNSEKIYEKWKRLEKSQLIYMIIINLVPDGRCNKNIILQLSNKTVFLFIKYKFI